MKTVNADVAAVFAQIADLLEVQGANAFRIRAYRTAARTIGDLGREVADMLDAGEHLDDLPGIGADLAGKIAEIVATGTCAQLERLRGEIPAALAELLAIPGLGPQRLRALHDDLGVESIADLLRAAQAGRVRELPGFGVKLERRIAEAATSRLAEQRRFKLPAATQVANALLADLRAVPGVRRAVAAGSLRRSRETVGDLDLLVTTERASPVMQRFVAGAGVERVLSKGTTRASVQLRSGLQVDLRAVHERHFGAAWLYFTGSKAHNIALRRRAQDMGFKLNEYGLYRGAGLVAGETERSVYRALGLAFIEPELREDRGEIDAAAAHRLPRLVALADLKGDLHAHTTDSDGTASLEAMAQAAAARGWRYLAITDHSQRLSVAHGLDAARLSAQVDRIDALNARLKDIVLLKGVEVDILEDGRLDLPDAVLRRLDLVIGAIHAGFDLPRERQTGRLLRAMDHPCFTILAHPTARLIGERAGCDIDLPRVIEAARQRGCYLELNADPSRLDLPDIACRLAHEQGVLVSIASDAHGALGFGHLGFGVAQARRGWLRAQDVLNTRSLRELKPLLAATMVRHAAAA